MNRKQSKNKQNARLHDIHGPCILHGLKPSPYRAEQTKYTGIVHDLPTTRHTTHAHDIPRPVVLPFMGVTKLWTWTVQNGLLKYGLPSKTMDFTRWRCLSETMDFGT
jgi:hypothetical protein